MCKIWLEKKFIGQGLPGSNVFLILIKYQNILGLAFEVSNLGTYVVLIKVLYQDHK